VGQSRAAIREPRRAQRGAETRLLLIGRGWRWVYMDLGRGGRVVWEGALGRFCGLFGVF
jgi:hypothetical protein